MAKPKKKKSSAKKSAAHTGFGEGGEAVFTISEIETENRSFTRSA